MVTGLIVNNVIEGLQGISWWLSKTIYKLIPDVYAIFEFFAKQKFFSMGELANFWNNLYIVMSVLVLFAIGIKLINAIVNPDALDGEKNAKKKSARRSFIDAVVAVFLIILVPMLFSVLNNLQTELIENKFIQKYIFGIQFTAESQTNVGQILSYQTLSSFLYPCDKGDAKNCSEPEKGELAMNAISWDVKNLDAYIKAEDLTSDGTGDGSVHANSLTYHPVLGLVAGALVLYQVILMALDMALRAAKIGMLELMLPIILGAFIFNREILTKWAKEFISTYLSAFLKLMAVTMMVLGLSRINIFFETFEKDMATGGFVDNNIAKGLLRLILLMGILRLVKEVPNIINKIFGTNIQYQGGIKGRLGQMAGVGALAQKAWTALGTGAKNLGKLGLTAVPAGIGAGVNALYKHRTGRNLTDTRAIRGIRAAGAGIGSAWKTGSWIKAVGAGSKAYDSTPTSPLDKAKRAVRVNKEIDDITTNPGTGNSYVQETNLANKNSAIGDLGQVVRSLGGQKVAAANKKYQSRLQAQSLAQTMAKNFNDVLDMNEAAAAHAEEAGNATLAANIRAASERFKAKGVDPNGTSWQDMVNFINTNRGAYGTQVVDNLIGDNGKLRSLGRQYEYVVANRNDFGLTDLDVDNFGRGVAALSFLADKTLKGRVDGAKTDYDIAVASARLSESDKLALDKYVGEITDLNNSKAFAIGRNRGRNTGAHTNESGLAPGRYD